MFNTIPPSKAAKTEDARTAILPLFTNSVPEKARVSTKIDIVKPIPPRQATPMRMGQLEFLGITPRPNLIVNQHRNKIPIGLPKTNPQKTPKDWVEAKILKSAILLISTPVLANANIGITKKVTKG